MAKHLYAVLILVVGGGIGFGVARLAVTNSPDKTTTNSQVNSVDTHKNSCEQNYSLLKDQLNQLGTIDFEEYVELKSQKERYDKANEIIGKMLVIFLADLGLKMSSKAQNFSQNLNSHPELYAYKDEKPVGDEPSSTPAPIAQEKEVAGSISREVKDVNGPDWRMNLKKLREVRNMADAKAFLDSVAVENLFGELKTMEQIHRRELKFLRGHFSGFVVFDNPERQSWEVEMSLEAQFEDGKLQGKRTIKLSENGEVFSNSNENGNIESLKSVKDQRLTMIIEAGGKNGYFHLFFSPGMNQLIGNYYREVGIGEFKRLGKVFLERI